MAKDIEARLKEPEMRIIERQDRLQNYLMQEFLFRKPATC